MAVAASSDVASADVPQRTLTTRQLVSLSCLWLPINLFWTVMLLNLLPHQVQYLVGEARKGEYLGYISFAGAIATTVIQLVVAPLSDACASRWGRRHPFVFWGVALNIVAAVAFAMVQNFWLLMLAFFGIQLFLNIANGPYQALLPDNVPPSQHGIASVYMSVALLIGQLLGGVLLFFGGKLGTLNILLIICGLLAVGAAVTLTQVPDAPAPPEDRMPPAVALSTLREIRPHKHPNFFQMLYSRFFINLSYSTVTAFLLYYLQDSLGLDEKGAGKFQAIVLFDATIAGLIGTLVGGTMMKTMSKKQVIYYASAVLGVAGLLFAVTYTTSMALVLAFLFGAGWGAFSAVDWALAVNLLPEGGSAKYMAVWHVCLTVPQIIAPAFGRIADMINKSVGKGVGWRAAMFSTVFYLAIGTFLLRKVQERTLDENGNFPVGHR